MASFAIGNPQLRLMLTYVNHPRLQGEKDLAEQQHRAVASHLQETVKSLEAKLQAQRDLTDSYVESHAREAAHLQSKIEQAQVLSVSEQLF
jgi:hypothetical protein